MSIILFSVLFFFTPILFGLPSYEAFELPKMTFVYLIGGAGIWLFLINRDKKLVLPSREILWFVAFYGISTLLSIHKWTSFWGYYKRFNGGLISVLVFVGIFIVLTNYFSRERIREFINYTALAAVPVAVLALAQHYFEGVVRATSTFGQPNWLAAFLAMATMVALKNFFDARGRSNTFFWSGIFIVSFWGLWVAYSISGVLGFVAGIAYFLFLNRSSLREKLQPLAILFLIVFGIAVTNLGIFDEKIRDIFIDVRKVYAIEVAPNEVSDPGFIRTELWMGTLRLFLSSPKVVLFGTGPETFPYAFQQLRPESLNFSSEWDFVFNKPHNYYLELLTATGLLGTLAYSAIIKRSLHSKNNDFAPTLIAFYITNIFGWPVVATSLFFWLILAEQER